MKPGKPFAFGRLGQSWFCGLPGNPVAAVVTMDQIVQPMLRRLAGENFLSRCSFRRERAPVSIKNPGVWIFNVAALRNVTASCGLNRRQPEFGGFNFGCPGKLFPAA